MIIKILLLVGLLLAAAFLVDRLAVPLYLRAKLKRQGVVFCDWPIVSELLTYKRQIKEEPTAHIISRVTQRLTGNPDGTYPPISGLTVPGKTLLVINSAKYLEEIFLTQNALYTKNWHARKMMDMFGPTSIFIMDTFHATYSSKRKALGSAFFKQKLGKITQVIKAELLDFIRHQPPSQEVDIVAFMAELFGRVFTSIAVGRHNAANITCDYEGLSGKVRKLTLQEMNKQVFDDAITRYQWPTFALLSSEGQCVAEVEGPAPQGRNPLPV